MKFVKQIKELQKFSIDRRAISVGCKNRRVRAGWVGLDLFKPDWAKDRPERFVQADALDTPFGDGFFGEVLAKHIFEHFNYYDQREKALREWWRILASGGTLRIVVPNQWAYVREFYEGRWSAESFSEMTFGAQDRPYEFHFYGYTAESLVAYVTKTLGKGCVTEKVEFGHDAQFPQDDLEIRAQFRKIEIYLK